MKPLLGVAIGRLELCNMEDVHALETSESCRGVNGNREKLGVEHFRQAYGVALRDPVR